MTKSTAASESFNAGCIHYLKRLAASCGAFFVLTLASMSASAQAAQDLVGFWYKPAESGWGLSIQQQGTSTFAAWFTYDLQGAPTFFTLQCTFSGSTCAGDLYTFTGMPLSQITAGANTTAIPVGTGSIVVTSSNRLSLNYSIGTVQQTKTDLEPQNFAAADLVPFCSLQTSTGAGFRAGLTNFTDHWWGGPNASGWGIQISHQANIVFGGWYSYSPTGKATWFTLQGTQDVANIKHFTGTIYQIATGTAYPQINGPLPPNAVVPVGTFEFNFASGETGVFTYSLPQFSLVNRTLPLERFALAGGPVNVCVSSKPALVSAPVASRFLSQATFGAKVADIEAVTTSGFDAWLTSQFSKPQTLHLSPVTAYINSLPTASQNGQAAFQWSIWKNFATGDDALRQRVAFALSEIFVVSLNSNIAFGYPRGPAQYLDTLGANAFGNYRQLLEAVTYSPMMGLYLTHLHNQKENAATGSVPDENYAREVMQLMSIGLYQLNLDGTKKIDQVTGKPIETYSNADVSGMAKVMTGLSWAGPDTSTNRFNGAASGADPDREIKPMQAYNQFHSISQKQFLGVTIPVQTVGATDNDVRIALDTLFNHPNVGPFIGKQLIQRLVSANPSEAYVTRVATVFNNNGAGVRGDMKAVIRAVLLDIEARGAANAISGKLREPAVRLVQWMRAFGARSIDGRFLNGTTTDPASQLGQTPMYAPSVFNFFRPGYIPPNSRIGTAGLVSPESQITTETSIAGYLNYMRGVITSGVGTATGGVRDIQADYGVELALAANPDALIDRVNLLLVAGNLSAASRATIRAAVLSVNIGTSNPAADQRNRVNLAVFLTMASPEYIFQN